MPHTGKTTPPSNRALGVVLGAVVLGLYLSIQLVWAAKGFN
ncbi:MAG: hypothetical protein WCZ23_04480 [Rhodospirillaceae bacterium]